MTPTKKSDEKTHCWTTGRGRIVLSVQEIAYSVGLDAGNASMRKDGRHTWTCEDYKAAAVASKAIYDRAEGREVL